MTFEQKKKFIDLINEEYESLVKLTHTGEAFLETMYLMGQRAGLLRAVDIILDFKEEEK